MMHKIVFGNYPFERFDLEATIQAIKKDPYEIPDEPAISEEFKDMLRRCMTKYPFKRITSLALLKHPFFDETLGGLDDMVSHGERTKATLLKNQTPWSQGLDNSKSLVYDAIIRSCFSHLGRNTHPKYESAKKHNYELYQGGESMDYWINIVRPKTKKKFDSTKIKLSKISLDN